MRPLVLSALVLLVGCNREIGIGQVRPPSPIPEDPVVDPTDPGPTDPVDPGPTEPPVTPPVEADAPIAQCSVSETTLLPFTGTATFDGSASYDPADLEIIEYRWELSEMPLGSSAEMPPGGAIRSGFTTDQAGLYVGRLVVVNAAGVESAACEVQVEAVPAESLWVEMFWDQDGDDMDLHLLAPGGTIGTPTDCYYGNCKSASTPLDWGVFNFADDNPILDRDDTLFSGPENINILSPAAGVYTVAVQDFGNDPGITATNVTVNIYIDGALMWTDTRLIAGDPTLPENFAEIDWPAGTITPL